MSMHNPDHPGKVLKELWLEPLGLTLTQAAMRLGVTRKTISKIINARGAITPEMALRLEIVFGTSAQAWMNMQTAYDLWQLSSLRKTLRGSLRHSAQGNFIEDQLKGRARSPKSDFTRCPRIDFLRQANTFWYIRTSYNFGCT